MYGDDETQEHNTAAVYNYGKEKRQKHFVPFAGTGVWVNVGIKCPPLSHCSLVQF